MKNRPRNGMIMLCLFVSASLFSCQKEDVSSATSNSNADQVEVIDPNFVNDPSDLDVPYEPPIADDVNQNAATASIISVGTRKNLMFNFTTEASNALSLFSYTSALNYGSLQKTASYSVQKTSAYARFGSYSTRYELRKTDPLVGSGKRSEALRYSKSEPVVKVERWYAASYYLPSDYVPDAAPECITQWHTNIGSPPLAIWTQNGQLYVTRFGNKLFSLGAYTKNQWFDLVLHVKWSTTSDGLIEVWKNGAKVFTYNGANILTNATYGAYMRTGLYKWPWNPTSKIVSSTTQRVLYVDEVRIGNASATYYDVAPGNY